MPYTETPKWSMYKRIASLSLIVLLAVGIGACDLLEVQNPNTLEEQRLNVPSAAAPMTDGLQSTVTRALGYIYAPYSASTDELIWVGTRDAWLNLSRGFIGNPNNEFSDVAFTYVAEAEWTAREFVGRLEGFQEEGTLPNEQLLARAYLYGAIIKTTVGDMFSNWAFSDKREAGTPIGEQNMTRLYDKALDWVNKGLQLDSNYRTELQAMKARILFSRSVWSKVHPADDVNTSSPLVSNQAAADAARAALNMMEGDNFIYALPVSSDGDFESDVAFQINQRNELAPDSTVYVESQSSDGKKVAEVTFEDPVDEVVHPYLQDVITTKYSGNGTQFQDIRIVSAREMHLIIAEVALANGDTGPGSTFRTQINRLRALDGLSPYDGPANEGVSRMRLLEDSRQANLYLQGRRLTDMYRFGEISPGANQGWIPESDARQNPGTFFPLTNTEIRSNPNVDG
ncbi:MAG: hypothetical protein ABEL97_12855 [Salinibacter sp.]